MGRRKKRGWRPAEASGDLFGDGTTGSVQEEAAASASRSDDDMVGSPQGEATSDAPRHAEDAGDSEPVAESDAAAGQPPAKKIRLGFKSREAPEPEPPPEPPAVVEPLARARDLVREGKLEQAIALYREIITEHPHNLKARNNLGLLYDGLGQHERALEQFESARAIDPENVSVISNLAGALIGMGRFEDAERELRRAMKLDLENVEVRANLGILYFRRGQYVQAENELRWVCEKDVEHAQAFFYRGEALNRLGKVDKAIEVMERAAHLQPRNAKIYHTMGILFDKKNMPAEAARMYKKVRELSR